MKKLILLWTLLLITCGSVMSSDKYYYYQGERVPLSVNTDSVIVYAKPIDTQINTMYDSIVRLTISKEDLEQTIVQYNLDVLSVEYLVSDSIYLEGMTNCFYIKLHEYTDTTLLKELVGETNTYLAGEIPYVDKWYKIIVANSTINNSLEMSNYFFETGLFADVDPGFQFDVESLCVSDSQYGSQWSLPAVNACEAWMYTKGAPNVTVAVIDRDIWMDNPEFSSTSFVFPYDAYTDSYELESYNNHGTKVTGVIAANHNEGVMAGVAPNVNIMPIVYSSNSSAIYEKVNTAISWAVKNGADIINCSWGTRRAEKSGVRSGMLESTLKEALFKGRGGKGCVVVFAAGNGDISTLSYSKAIYYPAYLYPEILVVGAVDSNGKNGGEETYSYGKQMDVVAPGVNILTTNNKPYDRTHGYPSATEYTTTSGTSLAAPLVSSIAALMLSVRPDLTRQEVVDVIEKTARHELFGTRYEFEDKSARPNGKWCKEVGYGLVDAYAAVSSVANLYVQNKIYSVPDNPAVERAHTIYAGYAVTDSKAYGNVSLRISTEVSYLATNKVVLKSGFHAHAGSNLHVKIVDYLSDPITTTISSPQGIAPRSSSAPADNTEQTDEVATSNSLEIIESTMIQSTAIYTISGQLLQTIEGGQRDATHLPNGMYILQHRMSDGSMKSNKIVHIRY